MMTILNAILTSVSSLITQKAGETVYSEKNDAESNKNTSSDDFVVKIPKGFAVVGILDILAFSAVVTGFTLFSEEPIPWAYYAFFGVCDLLGLLLVLYGTYSKVEIKGDTIKARIFLKRTITTTFSDIKSVYRHIDCRNVAVENLIVTTVDDKQFIVKRGGKGYKKFLKRIREEVSPERISECWS